MNTQGLPPSASCSSLAPCRSLARERQFFANRRQSPYLSRCRGSSVVIRAQVPVLTCVLPPVGSVGRAQGLPASAVMFAAVPRAILDRATIGFPLLASSQPRPGSASQPGCSSQGSASRTPVQPLVGSLQLYFRRTASHCWLLTLPMLEQPRCRSNTWWSGPADPALPMRNAPVSPRPEPP
ncbi:hypothetical protein T01_1369 [Trichinella spiralis]|uniref:Uncharacterized protein n=1 Tax=Trichinella spiralis TaxID=6334 RepID=A0A0V1AY50_TRISP|nr:hypothetical protein T01_1369 [Trichinella spiralis]